MIPDLAGRLAVHLTRWAHQHGTHAYLSTGCLHGDEVLPDGRTGHQYCQGDTGTAGAKTPAVCKGCGAACCCYCHRTEEHTPPAQHLGGNAEDCPACGNDLPYPWICPGPNTRPTA